MANPFQAAARGQAIRRLISTILSGKERDIAREDELGEIARRMQQERWQRGMAERGLDLEGRRVAEAERAGPRAKLSRGCSRRSWSGSRAWKRPVERNGGRNHRGRRCCRTPVGRRRKKKRGGRAENSWERYPI